MLLSETYKIMNEKESASGKDIMNALVTNSVKLAKDKFGAKIQLKDAYFNEDKKVIELQFMVK